MKKKIGLTVTAAALALTAICVFAAPGTTEDPLVSLSYIRETIIPEIYSYVDQKITDIGGSGSNSGNASASQGAFNVVDVKKGQKIKCGDGCEMILRMGSGKIIASYYGGISDVTAGYDLGQGLDMPANHLLIAPLGDGRGVEMTTDGKVMIKGTYTLE